MLVCVADAVVLTLEVTLADIVVVAVPVPVDVTVDVSVVKSHSKI